MSKDEQQSGELDLRIAEFEELCASKDRQISQLKRRVGSVTGLLNVFSEELEEAFGRINSLKKTAKSQLETLSTELTTAHGRRRELQQRLETEREEHGSEIRTLQGRLQLMGKLWRGAVARSMIGAKEPGTSNALAPGRPPRRESQVLRWELFNQPEADDSDSRDLTTKVIRMITIPREAIG